MQKGDSGKTLFESKRLRAPTSHGEFFQDPRLDQAKQFWTSNLEQRVNHKSSEISIGQTSLGALQELGRREVLTLATEYTRSYLDVDLTGRSTTQIVMSGHQPELFHPGVWFKNFSLSKLGKQFNAMPINLIVDNDLCGNASIRYPKAFGDQFRFGVVPIVSTPLNVPFEVSKIVDWDYFAAFPQRVEKAISPWIQGKPLVYRVWEKIVTAKNSLGQSPRLGRAIAMGRHRLENEIGLSSLEVPLNLVAQTESFAGFVQPILFEIERFHSVYNQTLSDYRRQFNVRSEGHPVPSLDVKDGWLECPFWIWQTDQPNRSRVYAKPGKQSVQLTDLHNWKLELDSSSFNPSFRELTDRGVAIRPRALMTTMFSRLILSDMFLHGIGGAIYDRLTDVICNRFFGVKPPGFMALSATMKLHQYSGRQERLISQQDLTAANQLVREMKFHPEHHVKETNSDVAALVQSKTDWVGDQSRSPERHQAIAKINDELQKYMKMSVAEAVVQRDAMASRLATSAVLGSREYSFALFPNALLNDLDSEQSWKS